MKTRLFNRNYQLPVQKDRRSQTKAQFPSYARNATHATQGRCVEKYAREYATHAREYATTEILRNEYATDATEYARTEKIRNEYATHAREYATTEILRNGIRNARKRIRKPN